MIKCIAIDDEPIALSIIRDHCRNYGGISLQEFTSPLEGMERILAEKPDIVFLDIEMKSHNGMELAARLPEGTCLIFTTAFPQYALEGFNLDAVDFLHKPIFYSRFCRAMEKALKWLRKDCEPPRRETITLRSEHRNVVIDIADISYIEAMDNYVKVMRRNLPTVLSQITMKEMEEMLPADRFRRVHRSYIVSLDAIDSFSNRRIRLRNLERIIPVGRKYLDAFNNIYSAPDNGQ